MIRELSLNKSQRTVTIDDHAVRLSPLEFDLLEALAAESPHVVSYGRLLESVWGAQASGKFNYLKLYVHYLRTRLEENPSAPQLIVTERNRGYRLTVPAINAEAARAIYTKSV